MQGGFLRRDPGMTRYSGFHKYFAAARCSSVIKICLRLQSSCLAVTRGIPGVPAGTRYRLETIAGRDVSEKFLPELKRLVQAGWSGPSHLLGDYVISSSLHPAIERALARVALDRCM